MDSKIKIVFLVIFLVFFVDKSFGHFIPFVGPFMCYYGMTINPKSSSEMSAETSMIDCTINSDSIRGITGSIYPITLVTLDSQSTVWNKCAKATFKDDNGNVIVFRGCSDYSEIGCDEKLFSNGSFETNIVNICICDNQQGFKTEGCNSSQTYHLSVSLFFFSTFTTIFLYFSHL